MQEVEDSWQSIGTLAQSILADIAALRAVGIEGTGTEAPVSEAGGAAEGSHGIFTSEVMKSSCAKATRLLTERISRSARLYAGGLVVCP